MHTHDWAEIAPEFLERANRMVWCSVATVDGRGRPRSRLLHPIREDDVCRIATGRRSPKGRDLAGNPYVSLAYVSDVAKPAYADCRAEWADDPAAKQHVWDLCLRTPPPLGFDPAPIYGSVDDPLGRNEFGVLRLVPYRVVPPRGPEPRRVQTPPATAS